MLRVLKTQGAFRELAEPNLIAMDGQQASFLAGGEFPVPVVQAGGAGDSVAMSVVFKEYGVRLNFKPTIIDEDHIRLELEPEVSTIDFANGVKFDGFVIPALRTRRAKTGVELRDGQSFRAGRPARQHRNHERFPEFPSSATFRSSALSSNRSRSRRTKPS